jgi:hypothetical protein
MTAQQAKMLTLTRLIEANYSLGDCYRLHDLHNDVRGFRAATKSHRGVTTAAAIYLADHVAHAHDQRTSWLE